MPDAVLGEFSRWHPALRIRTRLFTPFKSLTLAQACQLLELGVELWNFDLATTRFVISEFSDLRPESNRNVFNVGKFEEGDPHLVEQVQLILQSKVYPLIAKQHTEEYRLDDFY